MLTGQGNPGKHLSVGQLRFLQPYLSAQVHGRLLLWALSGTAAYLPVAVQQSRLGGCVASGCAPAISFNLIGQLASGSGPTAHRSPRGGCLHERQGTSIITGVPMQARCGPACVGGSYPPQGGLHHRSDPFTVASMRTLLSALACPFL